VTDEETESELSTWEFTDEEAEAFLEEEIAHSAGTDETSLVSTFMLLMGVGISGYLGYYLGSQGNTLGNKYYEI